MTQNRAVLAKGYFWDVEPEQQDHLARTPLGYTYHSEQPAWVLPAKVDANARNMTVPG